MTAPVETVTAFLAMWSRPGGFAEAVQAYFTPDTIWENVGLSKTTGPDEAAALYAGMGASLGAGNGDLVMRVDNLAVAATGDTVLTERIDHVLGPDGESAMAFRVMGVFELRDGKITAWRDYFDTAGLASQPPE